MRRYLKGLGAAFLLATTWVVSAAESESRASGSLAYAGNYRVSGDQLVGIDPFIMDDGTKALLISDYASGVVRRLFPVSETEFVMGVGFNAASPVELTVRFALDRHGDAKGISLRYADGTQSSGERVALKREELTFQGAEARLAGTLIIPPTKGASRHHSAPWFRAADALFIRSLPAFLQFARLCCADLRQTRHWQLDGSPNGCVYWRSDDEFALSGRSCSRCACRDAVASKARGY